MKKFILKCALFAFLFFLVDKAFVVFRTITAKYDFDRRLELVLDGEINKDLLIFGSSRADSNIANWMFKDSLGMETFNLSYRGATVTFQEFVLKQVIKFNKKPKYIIKVLDNDFELMHEDYEGNPRSFRIDRLNPLIKYSEIRDELIRKGEKDGILSNLFILHQLNKSNFYNTKPPKLNDTIKTYGAKPGNKHDSEIEWSYKTARSYEKELEKKEEIESLLNFQKICVDNDIKLIFTTAPVYYSVNDDWLSRMKELTLTTTQLYIHNDNQKQYIDPLYYHNYSHLNKKGAIIFTNELISYFKNELD